MQVIECSQTSDQNKALCPNWMMCNHIADIALQADHSKLTFFALQFLYHWIVREENARQPLFLSIDEGSVVSTLGTTGRTYNSALVEASWSILTGSLHQKRASNPETFLSKIFAFASFRNLQCAFGILREFGTVYENSSDVDEELFSPFTSLYLLVVAFCRNGSSSLDSVYHTFENFSRAEAPYKSVAAINCVILGYSNIWELDCARETFQVMEHEIGLTPNIHSYNALLSAFGKVKKTTEAASTFEHLVSKDVKPNATTYTLLAEAYLINRDPKPALSVIDQMVDAGFTPSKELLKKIRRRCSRELDIDSDDKINSLARKFKYVMGSEY